MEDTKKELLASRKNESRSLLKKCFKNPMFALVPFEIWRDLIVSNADARTVTILSHTCYAFKEIADDIGENNVNLALLLRREGQIVLAKRYLLRCAKSNNLLALFHVGYAHFFGGWNLKKSREKGFKAFKMLNDACEGSSLAVLGQCICTGWQKRLDKEKRDLWGKKGLSSNNSFVIGFCYSKGFGTPEDNLKAFRYFEMSAKEGFEFGQEFLAKCYFGGSGVEVNHENAFIWYAKAAEQGSSSSQHFLGSMCEYGNGCVKDLERAVFWYKKSARQGNDLSKDRLKELGIEF